MIASLYHGSLDDLEVTLPRQVRCAHTCELLEATFGGLLISQELF